MTHAFTGTTPAKLEDFTPEIGNALWEAIMAAGGNARDVEKFTANPALIRYFIAKVNPQMVDCDEVPSIPSGLTIAEEKHQIKSRMRGLVNPAEVKFYRDSRQGQTSYLKGTLLKEALEGQPVMPAKLLDWYSANPGEIPESWKGQAVFFWGTIYSDGYGNLCVRYLGWDGGRWDAYYDYLDAAWDAGSPALVSASTSSAAQPG
ncbi:TPA: hypothetical protein DEP96_00670 [Candidatus Uhrbacteria bacterium]|nr:hypothetical protein [Candidatus Uhrbacteria bacterium]